VRRKILHGGALFPPTCGPIRARCGRVFPDLSSFAVLGRRGNVNCKTCLKALRKRFPKTTGAVLREGDE
jgi:hypothetical protein